MPLPMMCLCFLVRRGPTGADQVLLGSKKRGLGKGKTVGLGGKVEADEEPRAATVREVAEESGVDVQPDDLDERAVITFLFPSWPAWDQQATVFVAERWRGEPAESPEIVPVWYDVGAIPFDRMWADARHWLPQVLAGRHLTAQFRFDSDFETLTTYAVAAADVGE